MPARSRVVDDRRWVTFGHPFFIWCIARSGNAVGAVLRKSQQKTTSHVHEMVQSSMMWFNEANGFSNQTLVLI